MMSWMSSKMSLKLKSAFLVAISTSPFRAVLITTWQSTSVFGIMAALRKNAVFGKHLMVKIGIMLFQISWQMMVKISIMLFQISWQMMVKIAIMLFQISWQMMVR